jgi:hypothetical protein
MKKTRKQRVRVMDLRKEVAGWVRDYESMTECASGEKMSRECLSKRFRGCDEFWEGGRLFSKI